MSTFVRSAIAAFLLIGTVSVASAHPLDYYHYDRNDAAEEIFEQINENAAG